MDVKTPRRVWITGASQGIGLACAQHFAASGVSLAICARRPEPLEAAAHSLRAMGAAKVLTTPADVSVKGDLARFASEALEVLGGCDVLIHNAGGGGPGGVLAPNDDVFEQDFRYAFEVNVMAAARLARLAADALRASGGVLVLVSSAWRRRPGSEMPASYGASKAALDDLTGSLAREFGPAGVRVVGVAPGPIWTETWEADVNRQAASTGAAVEVLRASLIDEVGGTTALRRPGTVAEVAKAIGWVSSAEASYMTGTTLVVDGGFVAGT
jgi:NAD(P)-dependent dehydrogenase (short-subunit alcohol dehydrogenase family)